MSFIYSLFLSTLFFINYSSLSWAAEGTISTFKVTDVKSLTLSVPKGKISLSSSKNQNEITVNVIESSKMSSDNKKCLKKIGLDGSEFVVNISSENILFEKADCHYEIVVVVPASLTFNTDISSGSAAITVKDVKGSLNLKTATGSIVVEGDVLKNIEAKSATGNMELGYKSCSGRADLNFLSATGKITLSLPSDCKMRVDYKSAAGKLFNALGESEDYLVLVNAKSASGDLVIKKR